MRLTLSILEGAPQITNALGERELDLRSRGVSLLDESALALLRDSFDVIDVTENNITVLENIPPMSRLKTIIAHHNKLAKFSLASAKNLPNLHTFVAEGSRFQHLEDLLVFAQFKGLERISLGGSEAAADPDFRPFMVHLCPKLKMINFQRVFDSERVRSKELRERFDSLIHASSSLAAAALRQSTVQLSRRRGRHAANADNDKNEPPCISPMEEIDWDARINAATSAEELEAIQEEMDALVRKGKRRR
jgi:hypothetical protein